MDKVVQLAVGQRVRCTSVDEFGFCGRDRHPRKEDVGFEGIICGVEDCTDEDPEVIAQCKAAGEDPALFCYTVCNAEGRALQFMSFEVEHADLALLRAYCDRFKLKFIGKPTEFYGEDQDDVVAVAALDQTHNQPALLLHADGTWECARGQNQHGDVYRDFKRADVDSALKTGNALHFFD